jgi:hypothetical protein
VQALCFQEIRFASENRKHSAVVFRYRELMQLTAAGTEMQLKAGRDLFLVNSLHSTLLFPSGFK